jgi:hypothetical protein
MKARVKATGEIVELSDCSTIVDTKQRLFKASELEDISDETDKVLLDELDEVYWANMKHQYAGKAMQAMLTSPELMQVVTSAKELLTNEYAKRVAVVADRYAHALVEKLKEKEERNG